ncbi:MAG: hypothetical protein F9B45_09760 [Phycisphaera sp. RhM]|nr:hypothetical protein [Phycisphaera sp. RhM]
MSTATTPNWDELRQRLDVTISTVDHIKMRFDEHYINARTEMLMFQQQVAKLTQSEIDRRRREVEEMTDKALVDEIKKRGLPIT